MKSVSLGLLLATLSLAFSDISGEWSGTMDVNNPEGGTTARPAYLILKQEGVKLTGTGGPDKTEQYPIGNGKVDGDHLTFEAEVAGGTMYFDMKLKDDSLEGHIKGVRNDGTSHTGKISVKRAGPKR